jgi:hypothetical protein
VIVVDVGGEEFDVASAGLLTASVGDERRYNIGVGPGGKRRGRIIGEIEHARGSGLHVIFEN